MKIGLFLLLILSLLYCVTKNTDKEEPITKMPLLNENEKYIYQEFKKAYMMYCLNYGYNSNLYRTFLSNDYSLGQDLPLGVKGMNIVDSLARVQLEKIKQDSIYFFNEIALGNPDYLGKKRVIQFCLQGYESTSIDSIAIVWAKKLSPTK